MGHLQIGEQVFDFGAVKEFQSAYDFIWNPAVAQSRFQRVGQGVNAI